MRRLIIGFMAALALACVAGAATAAPEGLAPEYCGEKVRKAAGTEWRYTCGLIRVPLDPAQPQGEQLLIWAGQMVPPDADPSLSPILLIPGGPGQAGSPIQLGATAALNDAFPRRAIVVFDPRGTGRSSRIHCPEFFTTRSLSPAEYTERGTSCAKRLGGKREFFTSRETVADMEAIRTALNITRWIPLGVSWGSVNATRYLREHPERLERVIIDSPLPAGAPELGDRAGVSALPRILDEMCGGGCPKGSNPRAAVETLARDLAQGPVGVKLPDARGRMQTQLVSQLEVGMMLYVGDMLPGIREELMAPLAFSWQQGDRVPMAMFARMVSGGGTPKDQADSTTVYFTTSCEEGTGWPVPNAPADPIAGLVRAGSPVDVCRGWSPRAQHPATTGPLPDVPLLVLSGSSDLRTPTENARELAALSTRSRIVVAENGGHSLITDARGCMSEHITAFMEDAPVPECTVGNDRSRVLRAWPRTLSDIAPVRGGSRELRAIAAVDSYVDALGDDWVPLSGTGPTRYAPGLRGGNVEVDIRTLDMTINRVRVVDDLAVSGVARGGIARYRANGATAEVARSTGFFAAISIPDDALGTLRAQGKEWLILPSTDGAPGREQLRPVSPTSCLGFRQMAAGTALSHALEAVTVQMLKSHTRPSQRQLERATGWAHNRVQLQVTDEGVVVRASDADHSFWASATWPTWTGALRGSTEVNAVYCTPDAPIAGTIERRGERYLGNF